MGGSQSTRSVSVSNENDNNMIRVSDGVVRRLRGEIEAQAEAKGSESNLSHPQESAQNSFQPTNVAGYMPVSSLQVRREVIAASEKIEKQWANRVNSLIDGQEKAKQGMETQFKKALNDVQVAFKGYNSERYENPCLEIEGSLTKCYSENQSQPLNCAKQVQAFSDCVQLKHNNMMKART